MSKPVSRSLRSISAVMPGFVEDIYISQIKESHNLSRRDDTNIGELCSSIQQKGLLQPVLVRAQENLYEIIAGNRRFRACKQLGWKKIACHIVEVDDKNAFEISLVENIHRKTLSPIEEANAFKVYISDFGWGGISDLAARIGKSKSYISKRIRLLNLPSDILYSITAGKITVSIAEELLQVKGQDKQSLFANLLSNRRISIRMARKLIKDKDVTDTTIQQNYKNEYGDHVRLAERSFDKSISILRIAMNSLVEIINSVEHDWIIYEVLMQHKNVLHTEIDILIRQKAKL